MRPQGLRPGASALTYPPLLRHWGRLFSSQSEQMKSFQKALISCKKASPPKKHICETYQRFVALLRCSLVGLITAVALS